jgi:hypothetical protein
MWTVTLILETGPGVGFLQSEGEIPPVSGVGVGLGLGVGLGVGAGLGTGAVGAGVGFGVGPGPGVTGIGVGPGSGTRTGLGFARVGSCSVRRVWLQAARLSAASPKSTVFRMKDPSSLEIG